MSNFLLDKKNQLFKLLSVSIHMCKWVTERMEEEREQTMLGLCWAINFYNHFLTLPARLIISK